MPQRVFLTVNDGFRYVHVCDGRMINMKYIDMLEPVLKPSVVNVCDIVDEGNYFQQDIAAFYSKGKDPTTKADIKTNSQGTNLAVMGANYGQNDVSRAKMWSIEYKY